MGCCYNFLKNCLKKKEENKKEDKQIICEGVHDQNIKIDNYNNIKIDENVKPVKKLDTENL